MAQPQLIDPFHRKLYSELAQDIDDRIVGLARGSAPDYTTYREQVAVIATLNSVLDKCKELEVAMYGDRPQEAAE